MDQLPLRDPDYRRHPAERILHVALVTAANPYDGLCEHIVHPFFDWLVPLLDARGGGSVQRKVLAVDPGGRVTLQRTLTSAADFERGPQSPGGS